LNKLSTGINQEEYDDMKPKHNNIEDLALYIQRMDQYLKYSFFWNTGRDFRNRLEGIWSRLTTPATALKLTKEDLDEIRHQLDKAWSELTQEEQTRTWTKAKEITTTFSHRIKTGEEPKPKLLLMGEKILYQTFRRLEEMKNKIRALIGWPYREMHVAAIQEILDERDYAKAYPNNAIYLANEQLDNYEKEVNEIYEERMDVMKKKLKEVGHLRYGGEQGSWMNQIQDFRDFPPRTRYS